MEDACHINFLIDFAHRKVSGSVVEYRSAVSEGLRFDCGLIIFSLFHALDRMKNIFLYFFFVRCALLKRPNNGNIRDGLGEMRDGKFLSTVKK